MSLFVFLSACSRQATQVPGFVYTAVALTQDAAAYQTKLARASYTSTPTSATLRPTITAYPTATIFVYRTNTPSPSPTLSPTPYLRTTWPDWKTGDVIRVRGVPGTNKMFSSLKGLQVIVIRKNGVKLRSTPNKVVGGPVEEEGSAFTLTGIMNKNPEYGWLFVQVIAANGKTYWVGGSVDDKDKDSNADPRTSLAFYYPKLTPTAIGTATFIGAGGAGQ